MNHNKTEMIFLLDRSGSMAGLEEETIGGFNRLIEKQYRPEGETEITAILFDDQYEVVWTGKNAREARLSDKEYFVRGCTALLDAIGKAIVDTGRRLAMTDVSERPGKVIFIVTTDGMENASTEFTYPKIKELIKHQQEKYSWEFIFMGANIDAVKEADSIGISVDNAYNFEASSHGVEEMYAVMCEAVAEKLEK